jgi:hypothetical protein
MANNFEIGFDPDAFVPPATNHADRGVLMRRPFLAFDPATVEAMISKPIQMPAAYTGTGTLKADIHYMMASATSGSVDFEISVEAVTAADALNLNSAESFDSVNANHQTVPGTAGYLGVLTITLTNKDSVAAGDYMRMKLERDADDGTNDTAAGDCRVLGVFLREEA